MKTFTDEEVNRAYDAVPEVIQQALGGDELYDFGEKMQTVYHLHIDTVGMVGTLIRNLLIGLINPTEFVSSLQEIGIEKSTVQQLTADLNEKIFIPLQNKMREVGAATPSPSAVQAIPAPAPVAEQPTPAAPQIASVVTPPVQIQRAAQPAPTPAPIRPRPAPYTPTPPSTPDAHREELKKIVKEYGADPYREPIQ